MTLKMSMSNFYDTYHKNFVKTKAQDKIISERNFTYLNFFRYVLPLIIKEKPKTILDIGSGAGTIDLYLAKRGFRVMGVELSAHAVAKAKLSASRLGLEHKSIYIQGELEKFSSHKKFDLILCLEVIEHLRKDDEFFHKINDLLAPEGLLVLSTPLATAPLSRLGLTTSFDRHVGHVRRYDEKQIKMKIKSSKLVLIKIVKTEGIIRNSLYVFPLLTIFIKFIRGPLISIITFFDDLSGELFGYSDIILFARKK